MLNLHIVQALYGDCLIVEYGTPASAKYILLDGGPPEVYRAHVQRVLQTINGAGGSLERVILSHVDEDHVAGLLDLTNELKGQRKNRLPETIAIHGLWHNTFSDTLGSDVERQFRALVEGTRAMQDLMPSRGRASRSIKQGDRLTQDADALGIGINRDFPERVITADVAPRGIPFDNLRLYVLGPSKKSLEALRKEWLDWLKAHKKVRPTRGTVDEWAAREMDTKVPNLSSIMVLAEADGKTILLPGDGRGDHLLEGLAQTNLLQPDADGARHVDVLKLPHHGSQRNVSLDFFRKLTADRYVVCADGTNDNPDVDTLRWLVQAAEEKGRRIEIWITNRPDSVDQFVQECRPKEHGYKLVKLRRGRDQMVLRLSA